MTRSRARCERTPANGEVWRRSILRSSVEVSTSRIVSTGPSSSVDHVPRYGRAAPSPYEPRRLARLRRARSRTRSVSVTNFDASKHPYARLRRSDTDILERGVMPALRTANVSTSLFRKRRWVPARQLGSSPRSAKSATCCRDAPRMRAASLVVRTSPGTAPSWPIGGPKHHKRDSDCEPRLRPKGTRFRFFRFLL